MTLTEENPFYNLQEGGWVVGLWWGGGVVGVEKAGKRREVEVESDRNVALF